MYIFSPLFFFLSLVSLIDAFFMVEIYRFFFLLLYIYIALVKLLVTPNINHPCVC